jgi:hypothetical protein
VSHVGLGQGLSRDMSTVSALCTFLRVQRILSGRDRQEDVTWWCRTKEGHSLVHRDPGVLSTWPEHEPD